MPELCDEALRIWSAGLAAVDARAATARALRALDLGPCTVVAIGKAGAAMAAGARDALGERVLGGIALVHDGGALAVPGVEVLSAGHPVPDARGVAAAERIAALVQGLGAGQTLLALISGGGSALLADPQPALGLEGLKAKTRELLASGAEIGAINRWRTEHATLKGGRLGRLAAPAEVLTLVLSDVPGHPEQVASGPTAGGGTLVEVGSIDTAIEAAVQAAVAGGWRVERLPRLGGEAAGLGRAIAARVCAGPAGTAWIGGGEPTVTVRGDGLGGRCQELALAAVPIFAGVHGVALMAAGTDGRDGPTDAAGAQVHGGLDPTGADQALARNDSYPWLDRAGALVRTGATRTNVGDLLVALRSQ